MTSSTAEQPSAPPALTFSTRIWTALDLDRLYALLRLRAEVFVVEQNCAFQDLDGYDRVADHLLGEDCAGHLFAYARLLPPGAKYVEASIGRLVTAPSLRGTGVGRQLLATALRECQRRWPAPVRIGAQQRLQRFYETFGFTVDGPPYLEDGIRHVEMLLPPPGSLY
ncbi:MAG: GNAT family N-acetyltransferase [Gammaproteobacteria bacterium]|nr:GNAT family N-acetyltransferase [Gammaproteobacteria bacterium]